MDPVMLQKSFTAKAEATENPGEFTALVSAFGVEDSQGDVVAKGAFTKSLAEWVLKGRPIPVVWSHMFSDPDNFLGQYTAAEETDEGLLLTGQMDMDHPKAARIHKLMVDGLIVEFSISGLVREFEPIEKAEGDEDSWWPGMLIKDVDLWEAGPCFKGANPETELLSIKSDGTLRTRTVRKEGRVLARRHVDSLKDAHAKLGEIIAAAEAPEDPPANPNPTPEPVVASALTPRVRALLELTQ